MKRIGAFWKAKEGSKAVLTGSIDLLGEEIKIGVFKNDKIMVDVEEFYTLKGQLKEAQRINDKYIERIASSLTKCEEMEAERERQERLRREKRAIPGHNVPIKQ